MIVQLIKRFEGYAQRTADGGCVPYLCSAGVLTIGYGATGRGVAPGVKWTAEQAELRLIDDLRKFSAGVFALSPGLANESEARQAAIISFCYNCGLGAYKASTLRKRVNAEDWQGAALQILKWDKAAGKQVRGLTIRRHAEAALLV